MNSERCDMEYDKFGDVMYLEVTPTPATANIDTVEIGTNVGFPDQIVARVDAATGEVYGIIIERYSAVISKLERDMAVHNVKQVLCQLVEQIKALLAVACPTAQMQPA